MKFLLRTLASSVLALTVASCGAASSPQELAKALQTTLDSGDLGAASRLANLDGSPAMMHSMILDSVIECSSSHICKVVVAPVDDAYRQRMDQQTEMLGIEVPAAEGLLVVENKSRDGSSTGSFKLPYAKVDGSYQIASARYSNSQLAKLRATSNQSLLQEMFAKLQSGHAASGESKNWATDATQLPEGGGPAGQSLVAETTAMHKAVLAKDPDAAVQAGDRLAGMLLGKTDFDGEPVSLETRKQKLQVMSLTDLHDVRIIEGYSLDDLVILVIEARDGIDWIVRGPVLMRDAGDGWGVAGRGVVEYPADG